MPSLYANARERSKFKNTMQWVVITVFLYSIVFTPLAMYRYGNQVQEIIIMNLEQNSVSIDLISLFAISMTFNAGMNFLPLNDIANNLLPT